MKEKKKVFVIVVKAECGPGTYVCGVYSTMEKCSKALEIHRKEAGESEEYSEYSWFEATLDWEE